MRNILTLEQFLYEGIHDPNILKAFFMAGGPGSGKSHVAGELFGFPYGTVQSVSYSTGLKMINSDQAFELQLKNAGIDPKDLATMDPEEFQKITSGPNSLRGIAKKATISRQNLYEQGKLGMVLDGTGDDFTKIAKKKKRLENLGYDTYMIFVNTSLEVARHRNANRSRSLPETMVEEIWQAVQNNLGHFQREFGSSNIIIIDNSENVNDVFGIIEKEIKKILARPLKNPIGKKWIADNK